MGYELLVNLGKVGGGIITELFDSIKSAKIILTFTSGHVRIGHRGGAWRGVAG